MTLNLRYACVCARERKYCQFVKEERGRSGGIKRQGGRFELGAAPSLLCRRALGLVIVYVPDSDVFTPA
jgi:hypothetical protein